MIGERRVASQKAQQANKLIGGASNNLAFFKVHYSFYVITLAWLMEWD